MSFGLQDKDLAYIVSIIQQYEEVEKAAIFGSRAKGNYKPSSDVDIAIWGSEITFTVVASLHDILEEESPTPYFFDIVDYSHLSHQELKEHIDRVGIVIFTREILDEK